MTVHFCPECQTRTSALAIAKQDLKVAARKLARNPDHRPHKLQVAECKASVADARVNLEAHEAECTFVPDAPPPVRGTLGQRRNNPPKPKPARMTREQQRAARVPDRSVLEAAIAAQEPVTFVKGRRVR